MALDFDEKEYVQGLFGSKPELIESPPACISDVDETGIVYEAIRSGKELTPENIQQIREKLQQRAGEV